jgi:murein DD-endopeptidase MepM/ murein hydrolase activator NlpD
MRGFSAFLALLTVVSLGAAQPDDPREDKKRADAELARTGALLETASVQAQAAVARLAELNQAVPAAQQRSAQARGAVAAAETQAVVRQQQSEAAKAVAQQASARYDTAAERVHEGRVKLGRFVAISYEGGDVAQFNALIGSGGPHELMLRMGYARKIAEAKKDAVNGLVGALWEAKQGSNEAGLAQRAADQALAAAQAALAEAAQARDDALRREQEVADLLTQQQSAVAGAESYRAEVLAQHEQAQRESERIAAELRAWEAAQNGNSGPVVRPGARFPMPVRGWKSSDFGNRYDPYYHVWQLHAGMDIAADGGDPIYVVADGTVASAGWRGGYGNYTCVAHGTYQGQSLSTCYAHQSKILVSVGQHVSAGQLIGRVGTTGASTGNHLHFEVRLDGTPVDPVDWLPGCLC